MNSAAQKVGVDAGLVAAIARAESSFNPKAKSRAGAMGLMQLMPGTARGLGVKDPWDPYQNALGGATYISQMLKKYNGNIQLALAAYNAGPGNVDKAISRAKSRNWSTVAKYLPIETQNYVPKVLQYYG